MSDLDLGVWSAEQEEWCIAASAEDAARCYEEAIGEPLEKHVGGPVEWTMEPPEKPFRYRNQDGTVTTKTNAEWIREKGRGYFASASI